MSYVKFDCSPGISVKSEPVDPALTLDMEKETTTRLNFSRPDVLLASDWLQQSSGYIKEQSIMSDAIATLLGDDLASDYKHLASGTSISSQGWGLNSCLWNNMPAVCQMSDHP